MPKCPHCEQMAGYEAGEIQADNLEITLSMGHADNDDLLEVQVGGSLTLQIVCAECGGELREGQLEVDFQDNYGLGRLPEFVAEILTDAVESEDPEADASDLTGDVVDIKRRKHVKVSGDLIIELRGTEIARFQVNDSMAAADMEEAY